jgi:hypothetical protein
VKDKTREFLAVNKDPLNRAALAHLKGAGVPPRPGMMAHALLLAIHALETGQHQVEKELAPRILEFLEEEVALWWGPKAQLGLVSRDMVEDQRLQRQDPEMGLQAEALQGSLEEAATELLEQVMINMTQLDTTFPVPHSQDAIAQKSPW